MSDRDATLGRWERLRALPARLRGVPRSAASGSRLAWRGGALIVAISPRLATGFFAIAAVLVAIPVAQVWLAKVVVDRLAAARGTGSLDDVLLPASLYALTLLLPAMLDPIQDAIGNTLDERGIGAVDRLLLGAGARLPDLYRIERPTFHDELRLLQQVGYYLPSFFGFVHGGIGTVLTVAGLLGLLAGLHPLLPLVLAVAAVPHLIVEENRHNALWKAMQDHSRAAREMDDAVRVVTEPAAAKEVRVYGLGGFFLDRFHERFVVARSEVGRIRLRYLRRSLLFGGLYGLTLAGGLWYVVDRARDGALTPGDIALYVNAVTQFQLTLFAIPIWIGGLYESLPYTRAFFALHDGAGPRIAVPPPGQGQATPSPLRDGVGFDQVSFTYPEAAATHDLLTDVTAHLPAGRITALVGTNGAGKSTLVKLLTRMYDPTAGAIRIDGLDLPVYDLDHLRANVAVAYQDFARFALSLRDNVAVGLGGEEPDDRDGVEARVRRAATWAGVDEVAATLARGYETELTRRFDDGVELSGGEWQKVALARAAVRDGPVLILDEPNSALDAEAEHRLLERFRELAAGRTVLMISHRLSTVRMADQILVLEGGRIVEGGAHEELVAKGGRYAALFEMQAGRYREDERGTARG